MSTMISLVGEQPEPILIPARHLRPDAHLLIHTDLTQPVAARLQKILINCKLHSSSAYDFEDVFQDIIAKCESKTGLIFNLTGGTKIMILAGYAAAIQKKGKIVYYQGEGATKSLLNLSVDEYGKLHSEIESVMPDRESVPLVTLDDFIESYIDLDTDAMSRKSENIEPFETAIHKALHSEFETKTNLIPAHTGEQIEIDLAIRSGLHFAIAEIKNGDAQGNAVTKGIQQLSTAGSREYLGIYTTKILILGRPIAEINAKNQKKIRELVHEKKIKVIEIENREPHQQTLTKQQADKLRAEIRKCLEGDQR